MKILKKIINKLKLAKLKKIDLTELKYDVVKCEEFELGDSTNTFKNKRFILNGKREIFKTYDGEFGQNIKNFRMNAEIICYYIGKQIGVNCAKVRFAEHGKYQGTISECLVKRNEQLITGDELLQNFCREDMRSALETYDSYFRFISELKNYRINDSKLTFDLFKMCVFDFLTLQQDRHSSNIHFLKRVINGKVEICMYPLIDNEYAFAGFTYSKLLEKYGKANTKNADFSDDNNRLSIYASNSNKYGLIFNAENDLRDMVEYAMFKPQKYMDFLKNTVQKFDIKVVINDLKMQGLSISNEEENWFVDVCEIQKKKLKKEIYKEKDLDLFSDFQKAIDSLGQNRNI